MTKKQKIRYQLAAACRANAAGAGRNTALRKVTGRWLMSADITGEAWARKYALHYTGAKYN